MVSMVMKSVKEPAFSLKTRTSGKPAVINSQSDTMPVFQHAHGKGSKQQFQEIKQQLHL